MVDAERTVKAANATKKNFFMMGNLLCICPGLNQGCCIDDKTSIVQLLKPRVKITQIFRIWNKTVTHLRFWHYIKILNFLSQTGRN